MRDHDGSPAGKRGQGLPDLAAGFDAATGGDRICGDEDGKAFFRIGDLARGFGVTARTLRFYEERGLLAPRREGQDRIYNRRDRARLQLVLMGKSVGFSLDEIRVMLDLYDVGDGQATQLNVSLARFGEQIAKLKAQRGDIDRAITELQRMSEIVAAKLAALKDKAP